jgi:hypothetical protein
MKQNLILVSSGYQKRKKIPGGEDRFSSPEKVEVGVL